MKHRASVSHDESMVRLLRKDAAFAAEYLKAALEDDDEPRVLLIALRHIAQARGIAKSRRLPALSARSRIGPCRPVGIRGCLRWLPSRRLWD